MKKLFSLRKLFSNTFEDHKGRPGLVGGSLPADSGDPSGSKLPSQEKILSEAERDYYWDTKNNSWVESPYDAEDQFKALTHKDLLEMDPEKVVTVKGYSNRRGGVARRKIKVGNLLLENKPMPTLSKAYPTMDSLISGLKSGKRDAEISAGSLIEQVISGSRTMASSGRLGKFDVKQINDLLRSMPEATESLGGESYKNQHLIQRLNVANRIYGIVSRKR